MGITCALHPSVSCGHHRASCTAPPPLLPVLVCFPCPRTCLETPQSCSLPWKNGRAPAGGGGRSWGLPDPPSLRVQMLFVSPDPTAAWLECSLHQRPPARDITVKFSVMEQWLWVKQVRVCSLFLPLTDL